MLNVANFVMGAQLIGLIVLAGALIARRRDRDLPIFTAYIVYSIAAVAAQWATISHGRLYLRVYWISEGGDIILAIAAVCESFVRTFRGFFMLAWFRLLLPALALLIAVYATWKAVVHPPVLNSPMVSLVVGGEIGLRYFIAGAFIIYVIARRTLNIQNFRFQYSVMLGFLLVSCGMLIEAVVRSEFGTRFPVLISWAAPVAYCAALLVWLVSAFTPLSSEHAGPEISADSARHRLEEYRSVLKRAGK